ncbi:MAG: hypothetical protein PHW34_06140 [Hespellia sp.]|nr:hypothetical protein [Hespellia sp.]
MEDLGGSNIKKIAFLPTTTGNEHANYELFNNGTLTATGNNEYGQLGDGTNIDYYDGYITVGEGYSDIYVDNTNNYAVALDNEGNIWMWGQGCNNSPQIVVEKELFSETTEN